jgi:transcriptional regulator with XRE-family HTH domain
MQPTQLEKIRRLLSLRPVKITVPREIYPPHWKSTQSRTSSPKSIGDKIRNRRLELRWLQADVARKFEVTSVSISNWERGTTTPPSRMMRKIQDFLCDTTVQVAKDRDHRRGYRARGILPTAIQLRLFENVVNEQAETSSAYDFIQLTSPKCVRGIASL